MAATALTATFTTVLSQDAIMTDKVIVDSQGGVPTAPAPFVHPTTGVTEALVVTGGRLGHVTRDLTTEAGWTLDLVGGGAGQPATAVAAGTTYKNGDSPGTYGLFQDDTALHMTQLTASGWSDPTQVAAQVHTQLRSAYAPSGKLVVHGTTADGKLAFAHQPQIGQAFTLETYSLPQPVSDDYALCMTDDVNWTVATEVGGKLSSYTGVLGDPTSVKAGPTNNYDGSIQRVVFGYWSDLQSALLIVFFDAAGTLQTWSSAGVTPVPAAASQAKITQAAGHVYVDPETGIDSVHVYTVDEDLQLAVLHQLPHDPWGDDGSPHWAGMLPLDAQISGVTLDSCPAAAPTLFAVTAGEDWLRLHAQDATTKMWRSGEVLQSGGKSTTYSVVRHRAEVTIRDGKGSPQPGCAVTVSLAAGSSAADVCVGGVTHAITLDQSVSLTTDALGKLTFAVLANTGIAAPQLDLEADGLDRITLHLAQGVHDYLAGHGTLNPTNPLTPASGSGPLPVFDEDGDALASGKVSGASLAPDAGQGGAGSLAATAAAAIRQASLVGSGATPPGVAGFRLIAVGDQPSFTLIHSPDELRQHAESLGAVEADGVWSEIGSFFGDVWEGIKNGAIQIADAVVHAAREVAQFTLKIAGEIRKGLEVALRGVEQAAHFMAGVFAWVGAEIGKVIDWLKALFDFTAIWHTKMALEKTLLAGPAYFKTLAALAENVVDGWFGQQEQDVRGYFEQAKQKYAGQVVGDSPGYQPPGAPDASTKVAGGASAADFSDNVHHAWLQDKVSSAMGTSESRTPTSGADPGLDTAVEHLLNDIDSAKDDFVDAADQVKAALQGLIDDPSTIATTGLAHILTAVEDIIEAVLKLADAAFDGIIALIDLLMDALLAFLDTPIDIPILSDLWSWLATQAGYPDDDSLTLASLVALIAAFPTTVIYKLIAGVSNEPFPPSPPRALAMGELGNLGPVPMFAAPPASVLISAILQTVAVIPACFADDYNELTPTWLTAINMALPILIMGTCYGFPDLSGQTWELLGAGGAVLGFFLLASYVVLKGLDKNFTLSIPPDVTNILTCAWGWLSFIGHVVIDIYLDAKDTAQIIAGLLLTWPSGFAFLNLQSLRKNPDTGPVALVAKLVIDVIGYLTGGISLIVDAAENL